MLKILFESKEDFISWLYAEEHDGYIPLSSINPSLSKRDELGFRECNDMGIKFLGLEEVSGNDDDDGDWAGKEHYELDEDLFPREFPMVLGLVIMSYNSGELISTHEYFYISDFKK